MSHLRIRCSCGTFDGVVHDVSPETTNRVICYCDDCQAFARSLDRGHDVLDRLGGTDITQVSQGSIEFRNGRSKLAMLRLSPQGTYRWYASCCNTPLGNTHWKRSIPFIGLIHVCMKPPEGTASIDDVVGPVRGSVYPKFAIGGATAVPKGGASLRKIMLHAIKLTLKWRFRGDHKRSPLFKQDGSNDPVVVPRILTAAELAAARAARQR